MNQSFLFILVALFIMGCEPIIAQYDKLTTQAAPTSETIVIDGVLDDQAWQMAPVTTGFTEFEPEPNTAPDFQTEVKILYDDEGVYFGAVMHDDDPSKILTELSLRDNKNNVDWFGVTLDTYQDGLNAFSFVVTATGVQQDLKFAGGDEDSNWDAVWFSDYQINDEGWVVEMFIPYSAIRFPNKEIQQWNIQFAREVRRKREQSFWNPVDPNFDGFVNQCGHLDGIKNIKSPVRLSVTPYVTGYLNSLSGPDISETGTSYNAGMDLKYGINDAFTLDMTLIPDFGQVQSDNQVLNLGPFEVFFQENRQFFTEGLELFDRGRLFYTRRVGGRPLAYYNAISEASSNNETVIDNPSRVQLYNASKISGRTSSGTGIGFFNAVTKQSEATLQNLQGETRTVTTSPLTNYNVMVVDQNLANNSRVSLINTNVWRDGSFYDANTTGLFLDLNNKSQAYGINAKYVRSNQFLEEGNNDGYSYNLTLNKNSGMFRGYVGTVVESDTYNPNDLGFLFSPNERSFFGGVLFNQANAKGALQKYEYELSTSYGRLFKPNVFTDASISLRTFYLFKSRHAFGGNVRVRPVETYDYFEPRDNFQSYLTVPSSWGMRPFYSSDYRRAIAGDIRFDFEKFSEDGRYKFRLEIDPRIRVNDRLSFFGNSAFETMKNDIGFVFQQRDPNPIAGVNDGEILMGVRDISIISNSIRGQYIFNNKQAISLRVRHYHSKVRHSAYGTLNSNGSLAFIDYEGADDTGYYYHDRNYNVFNIDMNYTWRFAPGSDIIVNWKNQIQGEDQEFEANYFNNLSGLGDKLQDNSFSLRVIYYLDYLYLKKN